MPTIQNPNTTGRIAAGVGTVGPKESVEVSEELAAALCDGDNFVRVEEADRPSSAEPTPDAEPRKLSRKPS